MTNLIKEFKDFVLLDEVMYKALRILGGKAKRWFYCDGSEYKYLEGHVELHTSNIPHHHPEDDLTHLNIMFFVQNKNVYMTIDFANFHMNAKELLDELWPEINESNPSF